MRTDLNIYLNDTAINQTVFGNLTNTTFDFSLPPLELQGMDIVISLLIIITIMVFFILYYQMRRSWK